MHFSSLFSYYNLTIEVETVVKVVFIINLSLRQDDVLIEKCPVICQPNPIHLQLYWEISYSNETIHSLIVSSIHKYFTPSNFPHLIFSIATSENEITSYM